MCGARYKAQVEREIATAGSIDGSWTVDVVLEWYDRAVQLVAGIRGSELILTRLLDLDPGARGEQLDWVSTAARLLGESVPLAAITPDSDETDDPSPTVRSGHRISPAACPSATPVHRSAANPLAEIVQIIQVLPMSEEQRSAALLSLQSLRDEMSRLDPEWEAVRPALIQMAGLGENIFFLVVNWVTERRRALGLS